MEMSSIPLIVVSCYLIGEIYKMIFKRNQDLYKLIPIVLAIIGGIIGGIIYKTNPEIILNADNIYKAIEVGIISGISATGANQIVKQLFQRKELKENDK